jgi:type IV pilus assembly protein PilB
MFFSQTSMLQGCPSNVLTQIESNLEHRNFKMGHQVLDTKAVVNGLMFVATGRVEILNTLGKAIESINPGDILGVTSLLTQKSNPYRAVAKDDVQIVAINAAGVGLIIQHFPALLHRLAYRIAVTNIRISQFAFSKSGEGDTGELPANQAKIEFIDISRTNISADLVKSVPVRLIRNHRIFPIEATQSVLKVGMVNPLAATTIGELKQVFQGFDIIPYAITQDAHEQLLKKFRLEAHDDAFTNTHISKVRLSYLSLENNEREKQQVAVGDDVVALCDRILAEGIVLGASDIHIQPEMTGLKVRYRVEGSLRDRSDLIPSKLHAPLLARMRVIADLDLTERNQPQDGRILALYGQKQFNFRISILPTERGEKVVLRVFDVADVSRPLQQIYLHPGALACIQDALDDPHGALFVGGATGSGKTSSLYSMLTQRMTKYPGANYVSVEDPVEYLLTGVTQVGVDDRFGLTFANVLRSVLRQDPDTIMVGELRDAETARTATQAALTGHLVLATLHANNAFAAIQRLLNLDCDPTVLAQATNTIVVQRLIKRLCAHCAKPGNVPVTLLKSLTDKGIIQEGEALELAMPHGCSHCNGTGFHGRVVVADILKANYEIKDLIAERAPVSEIRKVALAQNAYIPIADYAAHILKQRVAAPADILMVVSS